MKTPTNHHGLIRECSQKDLEEDGDHTKHKERLKENHHGALKSF